MSTLMTQHWQPRRLFSDGWAAIRFMGHLRGFLRSEPSPDDWAAGIRGQLESRGESFLSVLENAVHGNPSSPYRALMRWAGVEYRDVKELVRRDGLDEALSRLYEAGVRLSLEEFKSRQPIRRSGFALDTQSSDFDNPLITRHFEATTGGSRSRGTRLIVDLDLVAYEAAHAYFSLVALDAVDRPTALWRPVPPGVTGIKVALQRARFDRIPERWFSQTPVGWDRHRWRHSWFTSGAVMASRIWGKPLPAPEHIPLDQADRVAGWMNEQVRAEAPALLDTNVASAIRVCQAARGRDLDIAGSLFRTGGEPLTDSRAAFIESTGSRVVVNYGIAEAGRLGMACGDPVAVDDVHLFLDKVAVLQQPKTLGSAGPQVPALYVTTLHPASPKLMLNVEIGDYGQLLDRSCGCPFGELGLTRHLHTIRSYEKLTSEGMHFLGADLIGALESVLPSRFGGNPTDYQLVEEDVDGLPRVRVVVSPRVGEVDEKALVEVLLQALDRPDGGRQMMADWWRQGAVLGVVRREPYATGAAKIHPLHLRQQQARSDTDEN